jgi:hypothetical protein
MARIRSLTRARLRRSLLELLTAFQIGSPSACRRLGAALRSWLEEMEASWGVHLRAFSEHLSRVG